MLVLLLLLIILLLRRSTILAIYSSPFFIPYFDSNYVNIFTCYGFYFGSFYPILLGWLDSARKLRIKHRNECVQLLPRLAVMTVENTRKWLSVI